MISSKVKPVGSASILVLIYEILPSRPCGVSVSRVDALSEMVF